MIGRVPPISRFRFGLVPADLSGWSYVTPLNKIAVDPVLGRLAFRPPLPKKDVRVATATDFLRILGRRVREAAFAATRTMQRLPRRRGRAVSPHHRRARPVANRHTGNAIIEIAASGAYLDPISITLADTQSLQIRAANRARPVLCIIDRNRSPTPCR